MMNQRQDNDEISHGCIDLGVSNPQARRGMALWSYHIVFVGLSFIAGTYTLSGRFHGLLLPTYLTTLCVLIWIISYTRVNNLIQKAPKSVVWCLSLVFIALLVSEAYRAYPDCGAGARGGDRDEALELAVKALLQEHYPYYERTGAALGYSNMITPFPGAVLLAFPFVLAGCIVYQNHFWLAAFLVTATIQLASVQWGFLALVLLALTPTVFGETKCGGDLATNAVYVLVASTLFLRSYEDGQSRWARVLAACFLGIALASRNVFVLMLPQLLVLLYRRVGFQKMLKAISIVCTSAFAVTLPFYLYDPSGFTPLHAGSIATRWGQLVPLAGIWIPGAGFIVSIALAARCRSMAQFYRNCAIALAVPVIIVIFLSNWESLVIKQESIVLFWMNYVQLAIPFSVLGWITANCHKETPSQRRY